MFERFRTVMDGGGGFKKIHRLICTAYCVLYKSQPKGGSSFPETLLLALQGGGAILNNQLGIIKRDVIGACDPV